MRLELTKRADYAIRTVLALARTDHDERLSVRRIAAEQKIPERFLPQVMGDLVHAGLVEGTIGRNGGYRLTRAAADLSLLDIVEAVEGDSRRRTCVLRGGPCARSEVCDVHDAFAAAQEAVLAELAEARVGDLIQAAGGGRASVARQAHTARAAE
jgi:Rrf2 family protein